MTAGNTERARLSGGPRFFFLHAAVMAVIVLVAFSLQPLLGRVDYGAMSGMLYLHGLLFLGWCALAIAQPWLIGRKDRALHRRFGWAGTALAAALVYSGLAVTVDGVRAGRLEPANLWMALNLMTVIPFAALVAGATLFRKRTDWHRRLLASATVLLTGPAWARLMPMEALGPLGIPAITVIVLALVGWGVVHDRHTRGRIHPAWWWGAAAVAAPGVLSIPLALLPPFADWAATIPS